MKISNVSKKVLASALSAAMVVAFAPTAAFAVTADTDTSKWTDDAWLAAGYTVKLTSINGSKIQNDYYVDLDNAFASGVSYDGMTKEALTGTITLLDNQTGIFATDDNGKAAAGTNNREDDVTIDLNGFTISNKADSAAATLTVATGDTVTFKGEGTVANAVEDTTAAAAPKAITGGTVNVKGGTFTTASKKTEIVDSLGTVEGGTFEGKVSGTLATVKGGTFKGAATGTADTTVNISGGTFEAGVAYADATTVAVSGGTISSATTKDYTAQVGTPAHNEYSVVTGDGKAKAEEAGMYASTTAKLGDKPTYAELEDAFKKGIAVFKGATLETDTTYIKKVAVPESGDYKAAKTYDAVALSAPKAAVTFSKTVAVEAAASGQDSFAIAVKAASVTVAAKANLTVKADAKGVLSGERPGMSKTAADAIAIDGNITSVAKDATVAVSASSADADASAYAIKGDVAYIGAGTYTASAIDDENAVAVSGDITAYDDEPLAGIQGGKFTGELKKVSAKSVSAGSFVAYKTNLENFKADGATVSDDGTTQVVYMAGGFAYAAGKFDADVDVTNAQAAIQNATAELKKALLDGDATTVKVAYAEGQSADTLKQLLVDNKTVTAKASLTKYNVKTGTEADATVLNKINEFAASAESAAVETYYKLAIVLQYTDAKGDVVKVGEITDLGSAGREVRSINLDFGIFDTKNAQDTNTVVSVIDGAVAPVEFKNTNAGKYDSSVEVSKAGAYAATALSLASLKEAIDGQQPETPSVEKATQGIDVAQKSKTVKLAKGKTKTQKAVSFKLGASAETGLTIAKKSGSSRISVSGQKVTLKKGTKKGTFTAKVSIKAAASDEFLAAAKTITVKFVVKK